MSAHEPYLPFLDCGQGIEEEPSQAEGRRDPAAVIGEISRTPIGPWQSQAYRGEGIGTRHLLTHGMHSDYAVCADVSDMNIVWTGVVQAKITTFGKAEAAWGTKRSAYPMEKVNAIVAGAIGSGVRRETYLQFSNWPIASQGQYRCDRGRYALPTDTSPAFVRFYVDVRMPPQVRPVTIKYELDQVLEKLGIDYEMDIYKSLLGHERKNVEPLVRSAEEIYRYLFGERSALGIKRERAKEPRRDADLRTVGHHCLLDFATAVSIDDASFNPCLAKIPAF